MILRCYSCFGWWRWDLFCFYCTDVCTHGAKALVRKAAGPLAWVWAAAPNCTRSHYSFHCYKLAVKRGKKPISLKNVLNESIRNISFIEIQSLSTCLFNIRCDQMGGMYKSPHCTPAEVLWLSKKKSTCAIVSVVSWVPVVVVVVLWNTVFTWKNDWQKNRLCRLE